MADELIRAFSDAVKNEDLTDSYINHTNSRARSNDVGEMEAWLASQQSGQQPADSGRPPMQEPLGLADTGRSAPEQKPIRKQTDDSLGRVDPKESGLGAVMRHVSEIPRQVVGGVNDAAANALGWLNPLTDWLDSNVADLKYDNVDPPKTGTGVITRKVSEFLTGFIPALKALKGAGLTNAVGSGMAAGAIADFSVRNPHEARLADIWNEFNLPKNVLTDYLSSDPSDSAAEGRFKNALEGSIMGVGFEGVFMAARALRAVRAVKEVKQAEESYLKAKYGEVSDDAFERIGGTSRPVIEDVTDKLKAVDQEALDKTDPRALVRNIPRAAKKTSDDGVVAGVQPEDWAFKINFARIDEPDQVKFVIGKMAEKFKGSIDEARRGVMTQQETAKLADDLGMTVEDVLSRRKGQGFNAEEALAARQLLNTSAEQLLAAAKVASGKDASAVDLFNFRKLMTVHAAVQNEVIGARTETARALASWAIPAGGTVEKSRAIDMVMRASGGSDTAVEMARRLAMLAESGASPAAIANFARRGYGEAGMDALKEVWINGLLSSPKTHIVNVASNTLVAFSQIYERAAASGIRSFTGGEGVVAGEATAMAYGLVSSLKDAFRLSWKALRTGETSQATGKIDIQSGQSRAVSSEAFNMSKETGLGRAVDYIGAVTNVPGRLLGAEDEFFKTVGYRMELHAQALRQATSEGHKGAELSKRVADIVTNPPEHIRINSADAALYNTFTNETGAFGRAMINLRDGGSSLNPLTFVLPFIRTPVNIARYAFERTPFAPLVGQWRADIAAGGARADLALAKMSTGTAIMLTAMDYADSGLISGDGPKGTDDRDVREALIRQGWQPYSIKVGDKWVSYNRADPFGMTVGFAASIAEAVRKGELDEDNIDEWQEVTAMAIAAVSQVTISKTYLEGFSNFVEVMSDPKRYTQTYVNNMLASFLPAVSFNASLKNMFDPVQRETNNPVEAVMAKIAGLSEKLPPRRSLWGEKITSESGLGAVYDSFSPAAVKTQKDSPIDREIVRLDTGPLRITKKAPFDGVQANFRFYPQAYDDYVRLAGNDLKHPAWGVGAKDYLSAVVSGKHEMSTVYNMLSDESRKAFISNTISEYRKLAQQQVLSDPKHAKFAAEIQTLKQHQMNYKMPVLGDQQ